MASVAELQIVISGKNTASQALGEAEKQTKSLTSALSGMSAVLGSQAISQGIGSIASDLTNFTKAAADDAASQGRLQKAVENTGAEYSSYAKQLDGVISSGQKLGFTDDQTRNSLSLLAAQTGSTEEAVKRYALAQDLARGANIDVETASRLLGKVTEENVNVLARYGISVKEGASETELFGAIQQKFGGQAKEFGDSTAGAAQRSAIAMDEMKEAMGARLLPVMTQGLSLFQSMPGAVQVGTAALLTFGPAIGQTVIGFAALGPAIGAMGPALAGLVPALVAARTALMSVGLALLTPPLGIVVALVAAGVAIYIFRDEIMAAFGAVADYVVPKVMEVSDAVVGAFNAVLDFGRNNWPEIAALISGPFFPLVALATDAFGVRSALEGALNEVVGFVKALPGRIGEVAGAMFSAGVDLASELTRGILNTLSGLPGKMAQVGRDAANAFLNSISVAGVSVGDVTSLVGGLIGRASGGPVRGGTPYIVGERGPELFMPQSNGAIIPNHQLGGDLPAVNFYGPVTIQAQSKREAQDGAGFFAWGLSKALQSRGYA